MKRWKELVIKFRNENYRLFQLSTQSLLTVAIQVNQKFRKCKFQ